MVLFVVNFALIMENCPNLECLGLNAGSVVCETSNFMFKMPEKLSEIRLNVHAVIAKQVWICLFSQCQGNLLRGIRMSH